MNNFSRGLIAHEAAHQWFGDKITCGSWKDIWLNEALLPI
jgi:aminopeptidase N